MGTANVSENKPYRFRANGCRGFIIVAVPEKWTNLPPGLKLKEQNSWALPKITWVCLARLMLFHGDSQALLCLAVWCLAASCTVKAVQRANQGPDANFFFSLQPSSCLRDNSRNLQNRQSPDRISNYLVLLENKARLHGLIATWCPSNMHHFS